MTLIGCSVFQLWWQRPPFQTEFVRWFRMGGVDCEGLFMVLPSFSGANIDRFLKDPQGWI